MPGVYDMKPPRVRFEMREIEDRGASLAAGYMVPKQVAYAIVNPSGSKEEIERVADEWLVTLMSTAKDYGDPERAAFHQKLYDAVKSAYDGWKKGQEVPEHGVPVRTSLLFTPAERNAILHANIYTLEELAECSEQAMGLIGMGGRLLKERAIKTLAASRDIGKVVQENEHLKAKLDAAHTRLETLEAAIKELQRDDDRPRRAKASTAAAPAPAG